MTYNEAKVKKMIDQSELDAKLYTVDVERPITQYALGFDQDPTGFKGGYFEYFKPKVNEILDEIKPDLVIADILAPTFGIMADKKGIPCIINSPVPTMLHPILHGGLYPMVGNNETCCGFFYLKA